MFPAVTPASRNQPQSQRLKYILTDRLSECHWAHFFEYSHKQLVLAFLCLLAFNGEVGHSTKTSEAGSQENECLLFSVPNVSVSWDMLRLQYLRLLCL